MPSKTNAIKHTIRSLRKLLDSKERRRGKVLLIITALVSLADVIALATVVPVLMLAIDGNFLNKSSKLRWVFQTFNFQTEAQFLITLIGLIVGFFIFKNIVAVYVQKKLNDLAVEVVHHFTEKSFYNLISKPYESFVGKGTSELFNKIHFHSLYFSTGILLPFVSLFGEFIVLLFIVTLILVFNPTLFLVIVLITAPAFYLVNSMTKKKIYQLGEQSKQLREETIGSLNFGLNGIVDIKLNQSSVFFINDFLRKQQPLVKNDLRSVFYQSIPARANEIVVLVAVICLVIYGYFFSDNPAGLRTLAAVFVLSVFRLVPALNRMLVAAMKLKMYQHIVDFFNFETHNPVLAKHHHVDFNNELEINHISYQYSDSEKPLLKDISFKVKPGEKIGIRGASGSGKSTLMKIIAGLIKTQEGNITVDGVKLDQDHINSWWTQIGFVHQNPFVFNKSLHENITLSREFDAEKLQKVIQESGLQEFVKLLPNGIYSVIGENGSKISEGQKQRIAIARALYKNAKLLIFDEATSALDEETEAIIQESIEQINHHNVAIIIVAHQSKIINICNIKYRIQNNQLIKEE